MSSENKLRGDRMSNQQPADQEQGVGQRPDQVVAPLSRAVGNAADIERRDEWALRYVLGELSIEELTAGESQLADDVELCLAVSEAYRVIEQLRAAGPLPELKLPAHVPQQAVSAAAAATREHTLPATQTKTPAPLAGRSSTSVASVRWWREFSAVALSAAAVAVMVGVVPWMGTDFDPGSQTDELAAARLVELWDTPSETDRDGLETEATEASESPDLASDDVPSWLLAAVSLEEAALPAVDATTWEEN
jgi:hypothetical protein